MNNKHILHITAVTEVGPEAQKCTKAILEYDRPIAADTPMEAFLVEERTITGISVDGTAVTLELSLEDAAASTFHQGNPWKHTPTTIDTASVTVSQIRPIQAADGSTINLSDDRTAGGSVIDLPDHGTEDGSTINKSDDRTADEGTISTINLPDDRVTDRNDQVRNLVVDDFIQGEFEGLAYNLFIPKDCVPGETYPLVQFIHDAGPCGPDPRLTLTQGVGAVVWARPGEQAKRKCFVLAPQFDGPPIVDDDWNVDPRLETAKRLLDWVCDNYPVDRGRLYTTGQSMGCMSSIVLNVRYPDLFAASYLVAGQWDERQIQGLEKQKLWMINSMGDAKAFPGMNQMACEMESNGAVVARKMISAKATQEELSETARMLIATGANVIYTPFRIDSVADGWHSRGGAHHTGTWKVAYEIEAIREWLFTNRK
ncbi:MAG: hypothetical protein LUG93_10310 [Lachnospiraceae bacterium]|nr:hypothetical protein [Lachnospiraceae bacterium]